MVAITGALYVFAPEIDRALRTDLYHVEPAGEPVGLEAFAAAVPQAYPGYELHLAVIVPEADRAWEGFLDAHDEAGEATLLHAFFNQSTGEILHAQDNGAGFFRTVLALHRRLLAGTPGRLVVDTATCWGIVSMLSGLYLWWPRKKEKLWGVWLPHVKGGFRTVLRDWHTVPGVYFSLFVLAITVTGLLFTTIWGTAWLAGNALTGGLPDFYVAPPQSTVPAGEAHPLANLDEAYERALRFLPHHPQRAFSASG